MNRIHFFTAVLITLLMQNTVPAYSQTDTSKKAVKIAPAPGIDSNVLVVINGEKAGTIRELKKDINSLVPAELIDHVNILKGDEGAGKYGAAGKYGVIELVLKNIQIVEEEKPDSIDNKIFDRVEVEASFPGGAAAWRSYLETNLNAATPLENDAPMGKYTVIAQFIVDRDGNIGDLKALTKLGYGMEAEVLRIISKGPKWTPAVQNGRVVKAYRKQPVTFIVQEDGIEVSVKGQLGYSLQAGKDNEVAISVDDVKDENLELHISGGTVTRIGDGLYKIKVAKPGRSLLSITYKIKRKEFTSAVSFEVD